MEYRLPSTSKNRQTLDGILPYSRRDASYKSRSPTLSTVAPQVLPAHIPDEYTTKSISSLASPPTVDTAPAKLPVAGIRTLAYRSSDSTKSSISQSTSSLQFKKPTSAIIPIVPKTSIAHSSNMKERELNKKHQTNALAKWYVRLKRQPTGLLALYAMAMLIFAGGAWVSFNGLRANKQVAAQVKQQQNVDSAGSSNQVNAPSTIKPTVTAVASYAVAPNLPKYIDIPKLNVHARTLSMGVNIKNQLQAPGNVYDTGWYNASSQPGQPGSMLIDGHISSWTTHGVFYGLGKLVTGDAITITRGDNKTFTYKVVKTELVTTADVDMASMLVSQNTAKPGLSLISCAGDVIAGTNEFDKRQIIYAVMQ